MAHTESKEAPSTNECVYCRKAINDRLTYRLILTNRDIEVACCAHCGLLRQQQLGDLVYQAICYDFLRHTTISAHDACFVFDTTLMMGCCNPQVLPFGDRQQADQFIIGFEGTCLTFRDALDEMALRIANNSRHCHQIQE